MNINIKYILALSVCTILILSAAFLVEPGKLTKNSYHQKDLIAKVINHENVCALKITNS